MLRRAAGSTLLGLLGAALLLPAQEPVGQPSPAAPAQEPASPPPAAPPTPAPTPTPAPAATPTPAASPALARLSPAELHAHERAIILALQTVGLGERTYAAANGGLFGPLSCLTEPHRCIPGYAADGASFLDPTYDWLETRLGYARKLHSGMAASPDEVKKANAAPGSFKAWAYTATPLRPGETGLRGLCADYKGRLCVTEDGREPPVKDGLCEPCRKLQ